MKLVKILSLVTVLAGLVAVAIAVAPSLSGQTPRPDPNPAPSVRRQFDVFAGGSRIGATVRDVDSSDRREGGGVYVEEVRPGSPAEKAGLKTADLVTKFDGEIVRSVRQFSRLVQETPAGRAASTTVIRDGRATELTVTPEEGSRAGVFLDGNRFNLDLDLNLSGSLGRAQLGVAVEELTPQLATYFGAKDGVLVASVASDSAASRAGLKAGDVIASVNGQNVASRADLTRALRNAGTSTDVTIGIVRDKKESSVKARLDEVRARRPPPRVLRPVRATPA